MGSLLQRLLHSPSCKEGLASEPDRFAREGAGRASERAGRKKWYGDYAIVSEFGSRRNGLTRYYAKRVSQLLAITIYLQ